MDCQRVIKLYVEKILKIGYQWCSFKGICKIVYIVLNFCIFLCNLDNGELEKVLRFKYYKGKVKYKIYY